MYKKKQTNKWDIFRYNQILSSSKLTPQMCQMHDNRSHVIGLCFLVCLILSVVKLWLLFHKTKNTCFALSDWYLTSGNNDNAFILHTVHNHIRPKPLFHLTQISGFQCSYFLWAVLMSLFRAVHVLLDCSRCIWELIISSKWGRGEIQVLQDYKGACRLHNNRGGMLRSLGDGICCTWILFVWKGMRLLAY